MDVTRSWGFGGGRKRKPRDELAAAEKRRVKAEARRAKRARNAQRQLTCRCDAYPFPHRLGSESAPSSARRREVAERAKQTAPALRARMKRLERFAKRRDAARWGWTTKDAAPF